MRENRYSNQRSGQKQYHEKNRARGFSAVFGIIITRWKLLLKDEEQKKEQREQEKYKYHSSRGSSISRISKVTNLTLASKQQQIKLKCGGRVIQQFQ